MKTGIEVRLARHVKEKLNTVVARVSYNSPFAIELSLALDHHVAGYFRDYLSYVRQGSLTPQLVEDTLMDGNPIIPQNWEEMSRRYLGYRPDSETQRKVLGSLNIIDSIGGVYIPPQRLTKILKIGDISSQEFESEFGFDPSETGLVVVNEHMPSREGKLITQIHETIHARDHLNGVPYEIFTKLSVGRMALELFTDLRAYALGSGYLSDNFYSHVEYAERNGRPKSYFFPSKENVSLLRRLVPRNGHVDMKGFMERLKDGLNHDERIRNLILNAKAFTHTTETQTDKEKEITEMLDTLISLEKESKLPQVV